ncbi:hypothetical protein [Jeotgalibacillus marinus]|uniref:Uncharacterized protein n=1 Tax=Jeotgalibacillus marinus TaxID=86667 RepID=A0ABV3Q3Z7_9BACL
MMKDVFTLKDTNSNSCSSYSSWCCYAHAAIKVVWTLQKFKEENATT